ncbi:hypothetical protein OC861_001157 [Tilletia horrida]|nr:hypothetical protein OC861_001157 [Tilletia horrida]
MAIFGKKKDKGNAGDSAQPQQQQQQQQPSQSQQQQPSQPQHPQGGPGGMGGPGGAGMPGGSGIAGNPNMSALVNNLSQPGPGGGSAGPPSILMNGPGLPQQNGMNDSMSPSSMANGLPGGVLPGQSMLPTHSHLQQGPSSQIAGQQLLQNVPMTSRPSDGLPMSSGANGMSGPSQQHPAYPSHLQGQGSQMSQTNGMPGQHQLASHSHLQSQSGSLPAQQAQQTGPGEQQRSQTRAPNVVFPWSQRPLTLLPPRFLDERQQAPPGALSPSPFPRYGLAVNATASANGEVYLFGGLVRDMVKNDLYTLRVDRLASSLGSASAVANAASNGISAELVQTTGEIPPPRVGHATVLVSNVLILWGGDTKVRADDVHDAGLYLLNLNTREWTRVKAGTELTASASSSTTASLANPVSPGGTPAGPCGRYGHTVSIIASKLYVFGGLVDGAFLNDFWCFDLNSLKSTPTWELVRPANDVVPPRRTSHVSVTYKDCIYIFGGTDGQYHYNDTWCYSVTRNEWTELSCIGYIPVPREGHSACLVDDVMYVFGGRGVDGKELGDLASFKITNKRWYMFANMGPSPSGRSGHALICYQNRVVVLGGENLSGTKGDDPSMLYVLDTGKIKYPTDPNKGGAASSANATPSSSTIANRSKQSDSVSGQISGAPGPDTRSKSPEQPRATGALTNGSTGPIATQQNMAIAAQGRQLPNNLVNMITGPAVPSPQQQQASLASPGSIMSPPSQSTGLPGGAGAAGSPTSVASGSQQQHGLSGAYGKMGMGPQQAGRVGPGANQAQQYGQNVNNVRMEEAAASRSMSPTQRTIQEQRIAALHVSASGPNASTPAGVALQQQQQRAVSPPNGMVQQSGYRAGQPIGPASQRSLENLRGQAASPTNRLGQSQQQQLQRGINGALVGQQPSQAGVLGDPYSDNSSVPQPYVLDDPNGLQSNGAVSQPGYMGSSLNGGSQMNGPGNLTGFGGMSPQQGQGAISPPSQQGGYRPPVGLADNSRLQGTSLANRAGQPPLQQQQQQQPRGMNGSGTGALSDPYGDNSSGPRPYVTDNINSLQSNGSLPGLSYLDSPTNGAAASSNANSELAALRKRDAWMKVALAAAYQKGFVIPSDLAPGSKGSDAASSASSEELAAIEAMSGQLGGDGGDKDKIVKALLALKTQLARAQSTIADNARRESERVAEIERMRSAAIQEASFFRAKVQAYEVNDINQASRLERDRSSSLEKQLASAVSEQADLERRIASVTEQAKLEQHLRISAEERLAEAAKRAIAAEAAQMKAYDELSAAQKRSLAAESSLRDHQSQVNSLRSNVARYQSDYEASRSELTEVNSTIDGHMNALTQVRSALDAATARANEHERLYQTHRDLADQNQSQILTLRGELEAKTSEISLLKTRVTELQSMVDRTRAEADSHRTAANGALAKILTLHQEQSARKDQMTRSDAAVPRHVQDKMRVLEEEAENLRELHSQSRLAADAGSSTINEIRERNLALEKQYSSLRIELDSLKTQLTTALQEASQMRDEANAKESEAYEARRTAEALKVKLGVLRQHANEAGVRLPTDDVKGSFGGSDGFSPSLT